MHTASDQQGVTCKEDSHFVTWGKRKILCEEPHVQGKHTLISRSCEALPTGSCTNYSAIPLNLNILNMAAIASPPKRNSILQIEKE